MSIEECPGCKSKNFTYHGTIEGRGDGPTTVTIRSVSCDDCNKSWLYFPKETEQ